MLEDPKEGLFLFLFYIRIKKSGRVHNFGLILEFKNLDASRIFISKKNLKNWMRQEFLFYIRILKSGCIQITGLNILGSVLVVFLAFAWVLASSPWQKFSFILWGELRISFALNPSHSQGESTGRLMHWKKMILLNLKYIFIRFSN